MTPVDPVTVPDARDVGSLTRALGGRAALRSVAITRQMKDLGVNPRMYGITGGVAFPKFYETLGYSRSLLRPRLG